MAKIRFSKSRHSYTDAPVGPLPPETVVEWSSLAYEDWEPVGGDTFAGGDWFKIRNRLAGALLGEVRQIRVNDAIHYRFRIVPKDPLQKALVLCNQSSPSRH
jgi:hypothetical protein